MSIYYGINIKTELTGIELKLAIVNKTKQNAISDKHNQKNHIMFLLNLKFEIA